MNTWLSDPQTANIPDHDNGAFNNGTIDPTMAFLQQSPNPSDPSQYQRMFNGVPRNITPGFQNPGSLVPSKRSRPEDGFMASPRQNPNTIPASRSQTPQQHVPYPGYQGPTNGSANFPQPQTPAYQQFQPNSSTASPSPVPPDFDPQSSQRIQTASPSPFPPSGVSGAPQISPYHLDSSGRINPGQGNNTFTQGQQYGQSINQQYSSPVIAPPAYHPAVQGPYGQNMTNINPAYVQQLQSNQQLYQMHLQNQTRQLQAGNPAAGTQQQQAASGMNPMVSQQMASMRQAQQQSMFKPSTPEGFLRVLQKFMASRNLPLDPNPIVSGRPITLMQLYAIVMKFGGSKKVTATNSWHAIAHQLQFPAMQYPTAPQELRDHFYRNLAVYEQAWLTTQRKQSSEQAQGLSQPQQPQQVPQQQPAIDATRMPQQMSPVKAPNSHSFDTDTQHLSPHPSTQQQTSNQQPGINGYSVQPQGKSPQVNQQFSNSQNRSTPVQADTVSVNGSVGQLPTGDRTTPFTQPPAAKVIEQEHSPRPNFKKPITDPYTPFVLPESRYHGPVALDDVSALGEELSKLRPTVPRFHELGIIDIHALTMGVKSGIIAEVRVALDTLVVLSCEPGVQISLDNCDDLVESLVDCAEEQVELLAENAQEVSDDIYLYTYEEVLRGCRQEIELLADIPDFGTLDYDLDRAIDRLICITTILRNFSFTETNFNILSKPFVVKFLATVIKYLGTRHMLLRTHRNTLDFMKDAVTIFSNVSHVIRIPGKDEASCLLHFLLSFAPTPAPTLDLSEPILFPSYKPNSHRYLPPAVDSLAKLLARDDPNRMLYKEILGDKSSSLSDELLTRAFSLCIAPIPEYMKANVLAVTDARKPFLMQGLLAAEILSEFTDAELARAWLGSADGFSISLIHLTGLLSADRPQPTPQRHPHGARGVDMDMHGYYSIISRALSILRVLGNKSRMAGSEAERLGALSNIQLKKENVLRALVSRNIDPNTLRLLCEYAKLTN